MLALALAAGLSAGAARENAAFLFAGAAALIATVAITRLARTRDVPFARRAGDTGRRASIFYFAALTGAAILGFAFAPLGLPGAIVLGVLVAGAVIVEIALLPRASTLEITRDLPPRLALGAANEIVLRISHRGRVPLFVELKDRAPFELLPSRAAASFVLFPGATAVHRYDVTPPRRAAHRFEAVDVRFTRFPGLVRRSVAFPLPAETHVYPNLREVAKYSILLHNRREHMIGIKVARRRGKGTEFDALRDYLPDDEFRDISWKASARRGSLVTQTWQVERSQNVMILVEAGRMMSAEAALVGVPPEKWLLKLDHTIQSALVLAQAAALKEDRVGLLAFADDVKSFLPPKRGRSQLTQIVDALHDLQPALCEPDFAAAFKHLKARAKRRSLVALFTDVLDPESARRLTETLPLLAPQHLPLVIAVSDPSITQIASELPATGAEVFDTAVAGEMLRERREILKGLRARGALVLDVAPGELSAAVVNKYLEIKARNLL